VTYKLLLILVANPVPLLPDRGWPEGHIQLSRGFHMRQQQNSRTQAQRDGLFVLIRNPLASQYTTEIGKCWLLGVGGGKRWFGGILRENGVRQLEKAFSARALRRGIVENRPWFSPVRAPSVRPNLFPTNLSNPTRLARGALIPVRAADKKNTRTRRVFFCLASPRGFEPLLPP
jgi:hypothetical protein